MQLNKNRNNVIVSWSEVTKSLTLREQKSLLEFGNKYGDEAMRRRAEGKIADKKSPLKNAETEQLKENLSFLDSLKKIWKAGRVRKKKRKRNLNIKRKNEFVKEFSKVAEPLMRSMLTLAFTSKVLEQHLTLEEQEQLNTRFNIQGKWSRFDLENLSKIIELRSGNSLEKIITDIRREVEQDMLEVWIANWEDMKTLSKDSKRAKKLEKEMASGNLENVARVLMKGGING